MTDHDLLYSKLDQQEKILNKQTEELSGIRLALIDIKVQGKEIFHLNSQLSALWSKYDEAFGPEGIITALNIKANICAKTENDINSLNGSLTALYEKHNDAFGPKGVIAELCAKASACPKSEIDRTITVMRAEIDKTISRIWFAIALVVTLIGAIKLWG